MDAAGLKDFATRYTAAWCSRDPSRVASFFAENGSLKINDGNPSIGRTAIAAAAQEFMTSLPDMIVKMNEVTLEAGHAIFSWTLMGTNTGPGGTGASVHISGYEDWTIGDDGLIAESQGHFNEAEYQRQLKAGAATRTTVETATTALHQALRSNDADTLFQYVAENVVMMPPGEAPVRGKAAMRAWYARFLTQFRTTSLILTDREVFVGDGWAVEKGTYEWGLQPASGGDSLTDRGSYMQIWKLQADGRWLFAREIWNSSIPPAAP